MHLIRKLSPFRSIERHKPHALEIVECLTSAAKEHVSAAVHLNVVEHDIVAVVLEHAIGECAVYEVFVVEYHALIDEVFTFDDLHREGVLEKNWAVVAL